MSETHDHPLLDDIARLSDIERRIIARFVSRERVARHLIAEPSSLGDRIADRVASFGGSWPFIMLAVGAIAIWILINMATARPFVHPTDGFITLLLLGGGPLSRHRMQRRRLGTAPIDHQPLLTSRLKPRFDLLGKTDAGAG